MKKQLKKWRDPCNVISSSEPIKIDFGLAIPAGGSRAALLHSIKPVKDVKLHKTKVRRYKHSKRGYV